jgi:hypothetical protein
LRFGANRLKEDGGDLQKKQAKLDLSTSISRAFLLQVCIQLTFGSYCNQVVSLREICTFSGEEFTCLYSECMAEIKSLFLMVGSLPPASTPAEC